MDMMMRYPELYYKVYPMVQQCVIRYYPPYMPIYMMPDDDMMEVMVDEVYDEMCKECPEIDKDPIERKKSFAKKRSTQQRPYYGRRRIFRDLISILILRELMRRRRYPRYTPGYGPGYGPGYRY